MNLCLTTAILMSWFLTSDDTILYMLNLSYLRILTPINLASNQDCELNHSDTDFSQP